MLVHPRVLRCCCCVPGWLPVSLLPRALVGMLQGKASAALPWVEDLAPVLQGKASAASALPRVMGLAPVLQGKVAALAHTHHQAWQERLPLLLVLPQVAGLARALRGKVFAASARAQTCASAWQAGLPLPLVLPQELCQALPQAPGLARMLQGKAVASVLAGTRPEAWQAWLILLPALLQALLRVRAAFLHAGPPAPVAQSCPPGAGCLCPAERHSLLL